MRRISDIIAGKSECMQMAYYLVLGEKSFEEVLLEMEMQKRIIVFPFNPQHITRQDIVDMLEYYQEVEDYEKCAKLKERLIEEDVELWECSTCGGTGICEHCKLSRNE
tara:strand:+ start:16151 stop:16474 length:324 start_codon:yes stop_codon:yes gene_type:complete